MEGLLALGTLLAFSVSIPPGHPLSGDATVGRKRSVAMLLCTNEDSGQECSFDLLNHHMPDSDFIFRRNWSKGAGSLFMTVFTFFRHKLAREG